MKAPSVDVLNQILTHDDKANTRYIKSQFDPRRGMQVIITLEIEGSWQFPDGSQRGLGIDLYHFFIWQNIMKWMHAGMATLPDLAALSAIHWRVPLGHERSFTISYEIAAPQRNGTIRALPQ